MSASIQTPQQSTLEQTKEIAAVKHTTVLILGGGMAGVAAAHTLQAQGMQDFILLEASNRLGGRIANVNFCGHTIEEGANWIHGIGNGNNPILRLARECNLKLYYCKDETIEAVGARNSDGKDVANELVSAIEEMRSADSRMYQKALERGVAGGKPPPDGHISPDGPLPDCSVNEALHALASWKPSTPEQMTAEWIVHGVHNDHLMDGLSSNETSVLGQLYDKTYEVYGEEDAMVVDPEGYAKIVRHLASQTFVGGERDERLVLHATVREVELRAHDDCSTPDSSATSSAAKESDRVYVRTAEGHVYSARYCIITFSNPVLLSGDVRFIPNLPDWKLQALRQCSNGVGMKIFLKYADDVRPFWEPKNYAYFVDSETVDGSPSTGDATAPLESVPDAEGLSERADANTRVRNSSAAVRCSLKSGRRNACGYYTAWINFSIEGVLPGSNIIEVMLVDEMAKSAELKTDEELKLEIWAVLRRMYGKDVPEPESIHRTNWYNNPLTRVAYHCIRYGCTYADLENRSRPVNCLHFAGDGTSAEFTGYVHGAYNTGVQQANSVLARIHEKK